MPDGQELHLSWQCRLADDWIYQSTLRDHADKVAGPGSAARIACRRRHGHMAQRHFAAGRAGPPEQRHFLMCAGPQMLDELNMSLRSAGARSQLRGLLALRNQVLPINQLFRPRNRARLHAFHARCKRQACKICGLTAQKEQKWKFVSATTCM